MKFSVLIMILLCAGIVPAQQQPAPPSPAQGSGARKLTVQRDAAGTLSLDPRSFVQVMLPSDSPLEVVRVDYGSSSVLSRNNRLELDLNLTVTVRNRSQKPVEGLALAMGGASMNSMGLSAISGIRVESGGEFTLPAFRAKWQPTRGTMLDASRVQVRLDSVLFSDGSGYGPDVMRALSAMRMNQAESVRDRQFFEVLYRAGGLTRVLPALERSAKETSNPGAEQPPTRAIGGPAAEQIRQQARIFNFRITRFNAAPVEILAARAAISENRFVDPAIEVRNVSGQPISDLYVTWIVRNGSGTEMRAATLSESGRPQSGLRFDLSPDQSIELRYPSVLEIGSGPVFPGRVYLRAVQFADGHVWVPDRGGLAGAALPDSLTYSPEVIRLYRLYQTRGAPGLLAEIRR